jgi:hypothetical protein
MNAWRCGLATVLAASVVAVSACSVPKDPIVVEEGMVIVENLTPREWRNVKITVNDHFGGGTPVLLPGGRLNAPLSQFQTGLGQKFDRGRQSVFKVEVTASEPDGTPVKLTWGGARR